MKTTIKQMQPGEDFDIDGIIAIIQSQKKNWLQEWLEKDEHFKGLVDSSKFDDTIPADAFKDITKNLEEKNWKNLEWIENFEKNAALRKAADKIENKTPFLERKNKRISAMVTQMSLEELEELEEAIEVADRILERLKY